MNEELMILFRGVVLLLERADRRAEAEEEARLAAQAKADEREAADRDAYAERQKRHLAQEAERLAVTAKRLGVDFSGKR